jgi:hypothetical protein
VSASRFATHIVLSRRAVTQNVTHEQNRALDPRAFAGAKILIEAGNYGAQGRDRTTDTRIFSPLLYQLSYLGL